MAQITPGRLDIYGEIVSENKNDGVSPGYVLKRLTDMGEVAEIDMHMFSQGGELDAGFAIYSMLRQRPEPVTAYVEGIAASIATVIMCAADRVYMADSARLLIHNPFVPAAFGIGIDDARGIAADIESGMLAMARVYAKRTGKSDEEMLAVMKGETGTGTWFTAEEAIAAGFADGLIPETKKPREIAACLAPGVFSWRGHRIDLSNYPNVSKHTKGLEIQLANKKGAEQMNFFNRKKPQAIKAALTEMICPHCGAAATLDTESGEVALTDAEESQVEQQDEPATAKRVKANIRAELFTVTCPACGEEYVWDTDAEADGDTAEPAVKTAEAEAKRKKPGVKAKKGAPRVVRGKKALPVKAELIPVVCPSCGAGIEFDADTAEVDEGVDGTQNYIVDCPICGAEIMVPVDEKTEEITPEPLPEGTTPAEAYRKGVLAERQRMLALDEMQIAAPGLAPMLTMAKKSGASVQAMSRNVFKAMSAGAASPAGNRLAALNRDVAASGANNMPLPAHYGKRAAFGAIVNKRLEDR
ncbi:MAG: Clp protease ClpP [Clostridiales bacterium]|nr:Clp protease ClpP [Clostridiales bacterium]